MTNKYLHERENRGGCRIDFEKDMFFRRIEYNKIDVIGKICWIRWIRWDGHA